MITSDIWYPQVLSWLVDFLIFYSPASGAYFELVEYFLDLVEYFLVILPLEKHQNNVTFWWFLWNLMVFDGFGDFRSGIWALRSWISLDLLGFLWFSWFWLLFGCCFGPLFPSFGCLCLKSSGFLASSVGSWSEGFQKHLLFDAPDLDFDENMVKSYDFIVFHRIWANGWPLKIMVFDGFWPLF